MTKRVQSATELALRVAEDPALQKKIQQDPVEAIAALATPLQSDVWVYRMVVITLGLGVLIALVGAIVLVMNGNEIPDVLTALGSAAVGALAGLLAPPPSGRQE